MLQTEGRYVRYVQMALNIIGLLSPLIAAYFAIPVLLRQLGPEKFGLLTLFWVLIGYANIFELGLGRSVTRMLVARGESRDGQTQIIATALVLSAALGLIGMFIVWFGLPMLFSGPIALSEGLAQQAFQATHYVALALPILIVSPILFGVLEAHQRFGIVNAIRIPTGILLFAVPAIVVSTHASVAAVVLSMLLVRVGAVIVQFVTLPLAVALDRASLRYARSDAKQLLMFGGWLTVSAIVGPLLVYADRFLLASYNSLEETALYTTPFEAVIRFLVVPAAIVGVFFPRFVNLHATQPAKSRSLYREANLIVLAMMLPLPIIAWLAGGAILEFWLHGPYRGYSCQRAVAERRRTCAASLCSGNGTRKLDRQTAPH
jgi:O-antigen/teichoic acid export membrane protein